MRVNIWDWSHGTQFGREGIFKKANQGSYRLLKNAIKQAFEASVIAPGNQFRRQCLGLHWKIELILSEERLPGVPFRHLFNEGRATSTILLWMPFILSYYLAWLILSWTPTFLKESGASSQEFNIAFTCISIGPVIATVLIGILTDKFNPFKILEIGFSLAIVSILVFGYFAASSFIVVAVLSIIMGFFVFGGNSGLMGLAVISYPADIRDTGFGRATGIGRAGSLTPVIGGVKLTERRSVNAICTTNAILALVAVLIIFIMQKVYAHKKRE